MRGNDTRLKQPSQPRALKHTERAWLNDPYALMPPRGARDWRITRWRPLARSRAAPCVHEFTCKSHSIAGMRTHSLCAIHLRRPCASALAFR